MIFGLSLLQVNLCQRRLDRIECSGNFHGWTWILEEDHHRNWKQSTNRGCNLSYTYIAEWKEPWLYHQKR